MLHEYGNLCIFSNHNQVDRCLIKQFDLNSSKINQININILQYQFCHSNDIGMKRNRLKFAYFCAGARFGFPWGPSSSHLRRASRDRSFLSGLRARDHGYV